MPVSRNLDGSGEENGFPSSERARLHEGPRNETVVRQRRIPSRHTEIPQAAGKYAEGVAAEFNHYAGQHPAVRAHRFTCRLACRASHCWSARNTSSFELILQDIPVVVPSANATNDPCDLPLAFILDTRTARLTTGEAA